MINILLNSGGKDSNFFNFNLFCYNLFIKINNCYSYFEQKYSFLNSKYIKKKIFYIFLNKEYYYIINNYKKNNIDFYCNKLIKIYLIKIILNKKLLFTGHYFKKIKNYFFSSIDQKKDQTYFLNYKNNIFSINGYFNKKKILFFSIKNNFFCSKKKNTTGVCFKKKINFFLYIFFIENKILFNIIKIKKNLNLGKKFFNFKIIYIKKKIIIISKYKVKYSIIIIKKINLKNIFFKLNSQSLKKNGKIINFKGKTFLIFYKKNFFIEKNNILIFYNDLIINNFKIKKKN
ncbi:tRNA (5-methylaminomethyl-2-thiouridylate)-methyltransferase [Candidatus Carsonella ruddii]|uniref:Putative tRNA(5-methylaminomethyl-2-thiouridylate) methyltransferase n=1 Tax=Candidatus Carsonella ruddii HC isolate Thao2000 TaxID=1202538 RepID=J3YPY6_CARRU|nr:tRNA (5-methylaminomethyl-2-thiouridylate)-methyltransferase [Candidatus Carsonella ruddii]AFP83893.1 putative tRNA(5-methylaminomethyl-2- thiouridylate) methyltransferase [Candidatus Carsonella ruddii HC isolate Thao2000]